MLWEKDSKQKTVRSTRCSICYGRKTVNRRLSCLSGAAYVVGERRWTEDSNLPSAVYVMGERRWTEDCHVYPVQYMIWEKDGKHKTAMSTRWSICYGRKTVNRRLSCVPGAVYVMGERRWTEDCQVYPEQYILWEKDGKQKTVMSTRCSICYGRKTVNRRLPGLPGAVYVMGERR